MARRPFAYALRDALDGIVRTFRAQQNFRIQLFLGIVAVAGAAVLRFEAWRWAVLIVMIGAVLAAELFNTAIEHAVDLASPQQHPTAQAAKHAGAGAVLVACLAAVGVGAWLFGGALAHLR